MANDQTKAAPVVTDQQIHAAMSRAGNANSEEWGMEVCRDIAAQVAAPLIAERDALAAKLTEAEANALDAKRYRWLRTQTTQGGFWVARGSISTGLSLWHGNGLNAVIDIELTKEPK